MLFHSSDFVIDDLGNRCLLFVHSKKPPSDEDAAEVVRVYRSLGNDLASYRCIAITDGAAPTSSQRAEQQKEFGDAVKSIRTAVVSDALTVRFVVSSLALFVKSIKAFEPKEFTRALEFVEFPESELEQIRKRLVDIGGQVPKGRFKALDEVVASCSV